MNRINDETINHLIENYIKIIKKSNDFFDIKSMISQIESNNIEYDDSLKFINISENEFKLFFDFYIYIKKLGFKPSFMLNDIYYDYLMKK